MNAQMAQEGREEDEAFFSVWMKNVDAALMDRSGNLTAIDFPRFNYRESFDEGKDVDEVAGEILDHPATYN